MKIQVSSGKWLSQVKAMAVGSSCRFYKAETIHLNKVI